MLYVATKPTFMRTQNTIHTIKTMFTALASSYISLSDLYATATVCCLFHNTKNNFYIHIATEHIMTFLFDAVTVLMI